jgi:glycerophosphoryl diester phosphodiesterase
VIGALDHGATPPPVPREAATRPLIVAHRGAWDEAPQNSLAAVRRAAALGCDGIEIDVRRTADGQMVVVHDARLRWRSVRRLEHREVRARMEAGQAPLLRDVLDAAAGQLVVDVELKEDGYVPETIDLVADRLAPDAFVVTSFLPAVLAQVRRHRPQTRTGLLIGPRGASQVERRVRAAAADFLAPHVSMTRAGILAWAAQRDLAAWVWTVNDARTLQTLSADPRVAALITDVPADAVALSHPVDLADSRE